MNQAWLSEALGLDVSHETFARLEAHVALVLRWNPRINLVAPSTLPAIWERHVLDSAQILPHVPPGSGTLLDLGSGGGFPGLVIAALAAEHRPGLRLTLIESDRRKAAFLEEGRRIMNLQATILADRAERVAPFGANVLTARALAPLADLLSMAERHLAPGGRMVLLKGAEIAREVDEARRVWRFIAEQHTSLTDPTGRVLTIQEVERV